MKSLIEELQKYNKKLPAHFIFWKVINKNKSGNSDNRKIFTESKHYKTNQLLPIGYNKYISRNFKF